MAAESDGKKDGQEIFVLKEFIECSDLPKWVEVIGGTEIGSGEKSLCNIQKGSILLLRTLAVENVTLSFNDTDSGVKRIVKVSPESQVKFNIQLPFPDFKNPKGKRTVYKTVSDLLTVCPTYFKANVFYDDPYLPAIVKSGEVFRFIRQIKHTNDRRVFLQCEDPEGNVVELPSECRGDFTAVEDETPYTLKEIIELGTVDRKLRLSRDHIQMSLSKNNAEGHGEAMYSNLSHSHGTDELQRIIGLPLSYSGLLSFHKPEMFLVASPSEDLQTAWKVLLDSDLQVKSFSVPEYEKPSHTVDHNSLSQPVSRVYKLSNLLDTFYEDFPVLATLVHYKDMPSEFSMRLEPGMDVIIHDIERYDRILARSQDVHFSVSKHLQGRFRKTLRKLNSVEELQLIFSEGEEILVKVLQDVASDFPVPFSLVTGDVIRFKTLQTKMHKVKSKSKTQFGPFPVVPCEKQKESGSFEKLLLPADLEFCMHEMPSTSKADGFSADDVFRFKPELPFKVDYLPDYSCLWSCLPICSEISLTHFVTEPMAVVSTVPKSLEQTTKHIDHKVPDVLLIPARHHMMLTIKDCLGFPPNYFSFPDRSAYISISVEKISRHSFDELIRHNDMAYEDYEPSSPDSGLNLPSK